MLLEPGHPSIYTPAPRVGQYWALRRPLSLVRVEGAARGTPYEISDAIDLRVWNAHHVGQLQRFTGMPDADYLWQQEAFRRDHLWSAGEKALRFGDCLLIGGGYNLIAFVGPEPKASDGSLVYLISNWAIPAGPHPVTVYQPVAREPQMSTAYDKILNGE